MDKQDIPKNNKEHEHKKENTTDSTLIFRRHYHVSIMVGVITLSSIGLLAGGGYLLDEKFSTFPLFLILGLALSFPLSQYALYKWIKTRYIPMTTNTKS